MLPARAPLTIVLIAFLVSMYSAQTVTPDLVLVNVMATTLDKTPVRSLLAGNFQIWENGIEQQIEYFSGTDEPWELDILLKATILHPGRSDQASAAIRDAVDAFQKDGNSATHYDIEEGHYSLLEPNFGEWVYPAIERHLLKIQKPPNLRKALIVVTHRRDVGPESIKAADALFKTSRQFNIPIYLFYIYDKNWVVLAPDGNQGPGNDPRLGGDALKKVADQTGGKLFFVDPLELQARMKQIAEELRNEYVIGFKSTNAAKDDRWRTLKVSVNQDGKKLDASYKSKYFVPKLLDK